MQTYLVMTGISNLRQAFVQTTEMDWLAFDTLGRMALLLYNISLKAVQFVDGVWKQDTDSQSVLTEPVKS
jgi:hypothetical protein